MGISPTKLSERDRASGEIRASPNVCDGQRYCVSTLTYWGKGQKSLTLTESLHNNLKESKEKNGERRSKKYGVSTFTSYAQRLTKIGLEQESNVQRAQVIIRGEATRIMVRNPVIGSSIEGNPMRRRIIRSESY
jgi:hypothetical protein